MWLTLEEGGEGNAPPAKKAILQCGARVTHRPEATIMSYTWATMMDLILP